MRVHIYHTNDIHSNYSFLKKVYCYLLKHKTENDFYFDSGDYNDLTSFLVQADKGISAMDLWLQCRPDAMALGNNEIDMEKEAVAKLAAENYPIICCNLTDAQNQPIEHLKSSLIIEKSGQRFLILAVAPYYGAHMRPNTYNLFFEMGDLRTQETFGCIRAELQKQKGNYDYCILLSHSGLKVDIEIRRQFPEIHLCLGGHTHNIYSEKGYSQSGRGERLGKITLEVIDNKIKEIENIQIELPEAENSYFDNLLAEKEAAANQILSQELAVLAELSFHPFAECELINFICDALRKQFKGDLAMMHHGIAEGALVRPVSLKSLLETFPSKLNPTIYPILGKHIKTAVQLSFDAEHIRESGVGAGFRGRVLGTLGFSSNVEITQSPLQIYIDGQLLQEDKEYLLITDDYLQRGTGYPSLKVENDKAKYDKWFIRDLVRHFLLDAEVFEQAKKRRRNPIS
ncbi:bifunctional metallophosphatase/5'-nucleotidase [Clostridiales bacterium COT073_COT-073]|nr:bifunctional metallophosphatase/5'-nucleotidase [Clostridiales bacterium COT073_COT-073]